MKGKTMIRQNSIKNILREKGMTQKELCEAIGQDHINFNKIINNKRGLDHHLAQKVAEVLGVQWFQVYEPMNTQLDIHGTFDGRVNNPTIRLFDPIMDNKCPPIILTNYISDVDDVIAILDLGTKGVFIMLKDKMCDEMTLDGMYYAKFKNGETKFIVKLPNQIRSVNPNLPAEKKTYRQKPKFEYVIPVSRIDFDWVWVDNGTIVRDKPYPLSV